MAFDKIWSLFQAFYFSDQFYKPPFEIKIILDVPPM